VSPTPPIFLSTIFWIQRLSVIRLIFHKWRLIFALAIVDDPTPHRSQSECRGTFGMQLEGVRGAAIYCI